MCAEATYRSYGAGVLRWIVAINILLLRSKSCVLISNQDERQRNTTFKIELFYQTYVMLLNQDTTNKTEVLFAPTERSVGSIHSTPVRVRKLNVRGTKTWTEVTLSITPCYHVFCESQ